jgi:disulfide bond formation protein DsbB
MKNRFLILLIVVFAGLLIACGGGNSGSTTDSQEVAAEPTTPPPTEAPKGDAAAGEELFVQSCSSCHGADAKGIPSVGKDLTSGDFIPNMSDDQFVTFIKTGRPSGDPDNTTGIDMPPKGGNPALSDEDILDIIAYIRSIHE